MAWVKLSNADGVSIPKSSFSSDLYTSFVPGRYLIKKHRFWVTTKVWITELESHGSSPTKGEISMSRTTACLTRIAASDNFLFKIHHAPNRPYLITPDYLATI